MFGLVISSFADPLMQQERDRLLAEVENRAANSDGLSQKLQDMHSQKLKSLEAQVCICAMFFKIIIYLGLENQIIFCCVPISVIC